ncbi:MAG: MerR family transcriptional regulator [Alphaproteobacteria bacterium]
MADQEDTGPGKSRPRKSPEAFRTISEVAEELDVPQHVLRFWETRFNQIKPLKRGGGRRYYRPEDVMLLRGIRRLLYEDGLTIKGVQKVLKERGVRSVVDAVRGVPEDGAGLSAVVHDGASEARADTQEELRKKLRSLVGDLEKVSRALRG